MEKESADYGFKAFQDRDQAVDLIADKNDFDSAMALDDITNTDYDYGFPYMKRGPLKKLDRKGLGDAIEESDGFVEKADGYTRKPDIYATPEGAMAASRFIREEILPKYEDNDTDVAEALENEIDYSNRINALKEQHIVKQDDIRSRIDDAKLNYKTTRDADFFNRIRGDVSKVQGLFNQGRLGLDESVYRHRIDHYKKKMADVPDNVMYTRFANAIDKSVADGNELYDFRYY
jgi:hypothetical protein